MITSKDVITLLQVSPYMGIGNMTDALEMIEEITQGGVPDRLVKAEEKAEELGLDMKDLATYAFENVVPTGMRMAEMMNPPMAVAGLWLSAIRIGFLLGRGYVEDEHR